MGDGLEDVDACHLGGYGYGVVLPDSRDCVHGLLRTFFRGTVVRSHQGSARIWLVGRPSSILLDYCCYYWWGGCGCCYCGCHRHRVDIAAADTVVAVVAVSVVHEFVVGCWEMCICTVVMIQPCCGYWCDFVDSLHCDAVVSAVGDVYGGSYGGDCLS